jgi:antitoxin YefM
MFSLSTTYQQAQENLDKFLTQIETENSIGIITRQGHKDIAFLPAEELTSLLETIYLLRSPANAKRLFDALQRSLERDINPPPSETIENLCQELEIEREK